MNTINPPVAVGIDGSPGSAGALHFAIAEADRRRAPLRLVHVVPLVVPSWTAPATDVFPELRAVALKILEDAVATVRTIKPDLPVVTTLVHGSSAAGLVDSGKDALLLVVGRETNRGLSRVLFGATTLAVASRAVPPVAVVPHTWREDSHGGRVVVGVKDYTSAHELLGRAFAEADARDGSVHAVTSWSVPDPYLDRIEARTHGPEWEQEAREGITPLITAWQPAYPDVPADFKVQHGPAADVLMAEARDSDLLVLARRRHELPPFGHLGGVAHRVLLQHEGPIMVIPCTGTQPMIVDLMLEEAGEPLA